MKRFAHYLMLAAMTVLLAGVREAPAEGSCAQNWTANQYKSFGDIQNEIRKQFGDVRILRVALCGEGGSAYFQIVIMSGQGEVRRVKIAASG